MLPCDFGGFQQVGITCHTEQFQQSHIAGHHLIGFLSVLLSIPGITWFQRSAECHGHVGIGDELWTIGLVELFCYILGKVEVTLLLGNLIHEHGGLQDAAWRHAYILSAVEYGLLARPHLCHGVVQQACGTLQCILVTCFPVPLDESQQGIFTSPYVPALELMLLVIIAYVSILQLALHQLVLGLLDDFLEFRIVGKVIHAYGALHPFSPELATPHIRLLVLIAIDGDERVQILRLHSPVETVIIALSHISFHTDKSHFLYGYFLGCTYTCRGNSSKCGHHKDASLHNGLFMYGFSLLHKTDGINRYDRRQSIPGESSSKRKVRLIRLELTRPKAPDPKSGVSTNSTTSASSLCKDKGFIPIAQDRW